MILINILARFFTLGFALMFLVASGGTIAHAGALPGEALQLASSGCVGYEEPSPKLPPRFTERKTAGSVGASLYLASECDNKPQNSPDWKVSDRKTDVIVQQLTAARDFCDRFALEYQIDCIAERLKNVARSMPSEGDYGVARLALIKAASKLNRLARENQSPDLPKGYARSTGKKPTHSSRRLTPVRSDRVDATNKAAIAILQETETILLRSSENSTRRMVHYQRIAEAIGSNKVLLRSS